MREITTNAHGMASGAIYYDAEGAEQFQPAEVVIVACNGVGTPRLLLNSASARFPNGLANSSGLVGKNLMLHPWPHVSGYVDEVLDGGRGPITCMWSKQFYETDPARDFVRGYTLQFGRGTGPVDRGDRQRGRPAACRGARPSPRLSRAARPPARDRRSPARTCRRSTTASRSIPC